MQNCSLVRKSPDLSRLVFLEVCFKVVCISKVLLKKVFLKEYFLSSCLSGTIGEPMGSAS